MIVKFKFSKDHGVNSKGKVVDMHETTAKALEVHKLGNIVSNDNVPKKKERKGKAEAISASKNG